MITSKRDMLEKQAVSRPKPLWRNRDYLLLWSGQAISSVGNSASQLALPLLILGLTGSPAQAGFAGALRSLAYLLLGLPAGALIDRWDRKRTMMLCDAGRALALGSIPLAAALGHLTIAQLYLVSITEGALFVFFSLAESAALPHVVAKEQLPTWIRLPFQEERTQRLARPSLRTEMWAGLGWLWREPVVRSLALLHCGLIFAYSGITLLVLVIAERQHVAPFAIGLMFGIGGLGGILGALLGGQAHKRLRVGQILVGAFWLFALLWPLFAVAPSLLALGAILAAFWLVDEVYDVAQLSYWLALIPDALRGRVNGGYRIEVYSCLALSKALTGLLLQ
jgi:predicted MFS family arabinose efflux permease